MTRVQLGAGMALPIPPMRTLGDARVGVERSLATAAVAAWSPRSSTPERLDGAADVARKAATIIERSTPDGPDQDLTGAAESARAGADLLVRAGVLLRAANAGTPGEADPYAAVSAAAYDAYDQLRAAYLLAGGG